MVGTDGVQDTAAERLVAKVTTRSGLAAIPMPASPVRASGCGSGQATVNLMPGQPAAPSGMGGAGSAVWVVPVASVARHWM